MDRSGYLDIGGYYVHKPLLDASKLPILSEVVKEKTSEDVLESNLSLKHYFYNTGGTISARWTKTFSGVNCIDILQFDPLLKKKLLEHDFKYVAKNIKLSECYTTTDYQNLKQDLLQLKKKTPGGFKIIFTHGTDYLAYFASWIKLLAYEIGFHAVIICAQRSHDKPTCELHAILDPAIKILKSLKHKTAICVTYYDTEKVLIHDPFEIKKTDTYKKQAFWSLTQQYFLRTNSKYHQKHKESLKIKTKDVFSSYAITVESLFQTTLNSEPAVVLGSGLGNYKNTKSVKNLYSSKVNAGVLSNLIYKSDSFTDTPSTDKTIYDRLTQKYHFKREKLEQYSGEALHLFLNVLDWQY